MGCHFKQRQIPQGYGYWKLLITHCEQHLHGVFDKLALESAQHEPSHWLRYIDDMFVVWPHGPKWLQDILSHLSSLRPSIQFTMETESDSAISFLNVLDSKEEITLATKVCRKATHTGRYLSFNSNHPLHVKRDFIQSLHNRTSTI